MTRVQIGMRSECIDFHDEWTRPVTEWLRDPSPQAEVGGGWRTPSRFDVFMAVSAAVAQCPEWDGSLREEPRVGYDPRHDGGFFIFKLDNNGTSLIAAVACEHVPKAQALPAGVDYDEVWAYTIVPPRVAHRARDKPRPPDGVIYSAPGVSRFYPANGA